MPEYWRLMAEDIQPGDRVARRRSDPFRKVERVSYRAEGILLHYVDGGHDYPDRHALWWREAATSWREA